MRDRPARRRPRRPPPARAAPTPPAAAPEPGHVSVLYEAVLEALAPRPGGYRAVDCTVDGGGHSFGLLERSAPDGRLLGLDADALTLALAERRLAPFAGRYRLVNRNFRELGRVAAELGLADVDAIVFDLGLSSLQLEASGRGFSFRRDEPLDMRFDAASERPTAAELLNRLPEAELERLFRAYGEEPRARRLARAVVERRARAPFERTGDLVAAVARALGPRRGRLEPATRAFQAVRIAVNDELASLEAGLDAAIRLLAPGGRLAVVSFHSLEDRIVKWRFRGWAEATAERAALARVLTKRPIGPSAAEVAANPRARSAKLRVLERLAHDPCQADGGPDR
jgi:16S rRNA (cytosine1402-N4)-methyltransferase